MATRQYELIYRVDNTQALQSINQLTAALQQLQQMGQQTQQSINGLGQATQQSTVHLNSFVEAWLKWRAASVGLHAVKETIDAIRDGLKEAKEYAEETADANLKLRDSLRELAAIQGKAGPDDQVTDDVINLMVKTGQKQGEAVKFATRLSEDIAASRRNIQPMQGTPEQMETQIREVVGLVATKYQLDPEVAASTAVSLLGTHPFQSVQQFEGELNQTIQNIQMGKGSFTTNQSQVNAAVQPLIAMGAAAGMPEVSAYTATLSQSDKLGRLETRLEGASIMMQQAIAKAKEGGEITKYIQPGQFNLGDFINAIGPDLEAAGEEGGEGQLAFLNNLGLKNARGVTTLMSMVRNRKFMNERLVSNEQNVGTPALAEQSGMILQRSLEDMRLQDMTGQFGRNEEAAADYYKGKETERLQVMRSRTRGIMKQEGEIGSEGAKQWDKIIDSLATPFRWMMGESRTSEEFRVDSRLIRTIVEAEEKAGVSREQMAQRYPSLFDPTDPTRRHFANMNQQQTAAFVQGEMGRDNPNQIHVLRMIHAEMQKMNAQHHQMPAAGGIGPGVHPIVPGGAPGGGVPARSP